MRSKHFTFLTQLETPGQGFLSEEGSQIKGKLSSAQDVCESALELSVLLEALKARQ
jgi:hypothetical protein